MKRRFIRQNREIARVNSTQSQRIRNLETEISRLVAENVSLREQVIHAQAEAERWRATSSMDREVCDLSGRLQRKMDEMAELVVEMGRIPERAARRGRRKSRIVSAMSANTEQEWRNRLSIREAYTDERGDLQDGRLPAIQEDKLFPRRTLENAELAALREEVALQQASVSPELGPPPVAHFDVADLTGLDSAKTSEDENGGNDVLQLPLTLERRRKRRNSALLQNMPVKEPEVPAEEPPEVPHLPPGRSAQQLLKSGAKRKLSVSELDEPILQKPSHENDDFAFQWRYDRSSTNSGAKKASRFTTAPGQEYLATSEPENRSSPAKSLTSTRKILAPKSTNSPTKRRVHVSQKLKDEREEQPNRTVVKTSRGKELPLCVETDKKVEPDESVVQDRERLPKTPAPEADAILSPVSMESSTRATHQTKEAAVLNSVEDVLNGSLGRGSRRTRPAVSYAEPNLRDKMRRPGKELVGAVEGLDKSRDSSLRGVSVDQAKSEDVVTGEDPSQVLKIKQEKEAAADERWKELPVRKTEDPASPLCDKGRTERAPSDTKKATEIRRSNPAGTLEQAVDRLSIFDPPVSSPMDGSENAQPSTDEHKPPSAEVSTATRKPSSSRRHSVQPSSYSSANPPSTNLPPRLASASRPLIARAPLSRPNSMASTRSERMASVVKDIKRSRRISSTLMAEEPATSGAEPPDNVSSRAERTLNRRRSMMV